MIGNLRCLVLDEADRLLENAEMTPAVFGALKAAGPLSHVDGAAETFSGALVPRWKGRRRPSLNPDPGVRLLPEARELAHLAPFGHLALAEKRRGVGHARRPRLAARSARLRDVPTGPRGPRRGWRTNDRCARLHCSCPSTTGPKLWKGSSSGAPKFVGTDARWAWTRRPSTRGQLRRCGPGRLHPPRRAVRNGHRGWPCR